MSPERDKLKAGITDAETEAVSRRYQQAEQAEPPASLDATVLAASRRAVQAGPRSVGPFSGRWQIPASIAAVVVISVLLVPVMTSRVPPAPDPAADSASAERPSEPVSAPAARAKRQLAPSLSAPARMLADDVDGPRREREEKGLQYYRQFDPAPQAADVEAASTAKVPAAGALMELRESDTLSLLPQQWQQAIARLLAVGETEAARRQLQALREAYPDYPLDPALVEQLQSSVKAGEPAAPADRNTP